MVLGQAGGYRRLQIHRPGPRELSRTDRVGEFLDRHLSNIGVLDWLPTCQDCAEACIDEEVEEDDEEDEEQEESGCDSGSCSGKQ